MNNISVLILRRVMAWPQTTLRRPVAYAMFVLLVALDRVMQRSHE